MDKKRWLYLVVAVVCVVGLLASGCAKAPEKPVVPPVEEGEWVPPIAGMKRGEENLYFEWLWGLPSARSAPPAGFTETSPEYFFRLIEERTGGRLKVNINYGELGTMLEMQRLTTAGVIDGGFSTPTYYPIEMPLEGICWMPLFSIEDWGQNIDLWDYVFAHPLVQENLAMDNMIHGYCLSGAGDYDLQIRKGVREITKIEDFKGLTARSYAYYSVMWAELGMAPVFIAAYEVYEGFQKGMLDVSHSSTVPGFKTKGMDEVVDRIIDMAITATSAPYTCNLDSWNSLPQYIQDIWRETHKEAQAYHLELSLAEREPTFAYLEEKGVRYYKLAPAEQAKFDAAARPAYEAWIADCLKQERGKKIKAFLKDVIAYRDNLTGTHWDICDGLY